MGVSRRTEKAKQKGKKSNAFSIGGRLAPSLVENSCGGSLSLFSVQPRPRKQERERERGSRAFLLRLPLQKQATSGTLACLLESERNRKRERERERESTHPPPSTTPTKNLKKKLDSPRHPQAHPRRALRPRPLRRRGVHPGRRAPPPPGEEAQPGRLRRLRALGPHAHRAGRDEGPQRQQTHQIGRDLQVLGRGLVRAAEQQDGRGPGQDQGGRGLHGEQKGIQSGTFLCVLFSSEFF